MKGQKWALFLSFAKIGAFTFGGGYAMISLIEQEAVEKHRWIHDEDMLDILAIAESTPGPISINSATFIGYKTAGIAGAAAATLGLVLPSFVIIYILSFFIMQYQKIEWLKYAFEGIRAGVAVLITKAVFKMAKPCPKNLTNWILMGVAFVLAAFFHANVILLLVGCGAVGLVRHLLSKKEGGV